MGKTFTRRELYTLVWGEPVRTIAKRLGVSDVAVAKACRKAAIPLPPRGYWARRWSGQKLPNVPLTPREPGHLDTVAVGQTRRDHWTSRSINENGPEPVAPVFEEAIEAVRARIERRTQAVRVESGFEKAHPAIRALIDEVDERREKLLAVTHRALWHDTVPDTQPEKRRLRILNALLLALARQGFGGLIRGEKGDGITVRIGRSHIELEFSQIATPGRQGHRGGRQPRERLRLSVRSGYKVEGRMLAEDEPERRLEQQLRRIVVDVIVLGEERHRQQEINHHEWLIARIRQLADEKQRRTEEAERNERERLATVEQARVGRLLREAASLKNANDIRRYVQAVNATCSDGQSPVSSKELSAWTFWALAQADRIDPVVTREFLMPS